MDVLALRPREPVAVEAHDRVRQVSALPGADASRRAAHRRLAPAEVPLAAEHRFDGALDVAMGLLAAALEPRETPALRVDEAGRRHRGDLPGLAGLAGAIPSDEEPHGILRDESLDRRLPILERHGEDLQTRRRVPRGEPVEERKPLPARQTPRGPELEQHRTAAEIREPVRSALQV